MADPNLYVKHFVKNCILKPPAPVEPLWNKWKGPYAEYTVQPGDSLKSIAKTFAESGKATGGLNWKQLTLFNLGTDHPPYVNWCLVDKFGFDENVNLTSDHKNYSFSGNGTEKLMIPLLPLAAVPPPVARHVPNTIIIPKVEVAAVEGPSLMTEGIMSEFRVTGYSVPMKRVTQAIKNSVKWKVKDLDTGTETNRAEKGEKVKFSLPGLGKKYRVYPFLQAKNELIRCDLQIIKVELEHEIPISDVDDKLIRPTDPLNKIHNPAAIVVGATDPKKCACFRLTKVEPASFVLASNDDDFTWKLDNTKGEAKFCTEIGAPPDTNIGCDCKVYGVKPGFVTLEAYTTYAVSPCEKLKLMVVEERTIPYRANFLGRSFLWLFSRSTDFTHEKVKDTIAIANIHLWQVGLRLVSDTNTTLYKVGNEKIKPIAGYSGYFDVSNVQSEYVEDISLRNNYADAVQACRVNSRSGVVNFNFIISIRHQGPGTVLGVGPVIPHNLHSTSYSGPDEKDTTPPPNSKVIPTPFINAPSAEGRGGILIADATVNQTETMVGAVLAHELGHVLAMWHRSPSDDGLPESRWNLMFSTVSKDTQTDMDLVQLVISRGSSLAPGNPGNLIIEADKLTLKGASFSTHRVNLSAKRGTLVPNTRFNYWVLPFKSTVARISGTDLPASQISASGNAWIDVILRGASGEKANVIIMVGENDDRATEIIQCEIT